MLSSVEQAFMGRDKKPAPLKKPAWEASGGLGKKIWALFRRRYSPGFDYVTSATQARFSLQGHYSGQLFTPAELSPLGPKPENYSCR